MLVVSVEYDWLELNDIKLKFVNSDKFLTKLLTFVCSRLHKVGVCTISIKVINVSAMFYVVVSGFQF